MEKELDLRKPAVRERVELENRNFGKTGLPVTKIHHIDCKPYVGIITDKKN